ncbi:NUDIX hydrolase [Aliikangiella coralliicola]|uniref:Phosphatase NudJ n=1 Tax=Aliikangiella coralliicola TaxID=2592383 RepID=A0A545U4Q9_9GAMM|nr:NUDIX hydrolase [Aliikangiella coralliicola]TQV84460.1 NUDIX hydrolase [Aliikangiella coralliicola]
MDSIHVTVAAIIRRNDQFLLVKEKASSGQIVFNQPAGHVELNESLTDAVVREVAEETGLTYTPTALLGTYLLSPAANGKTYLRFCFVGDVPDEQQPSPQDSDILDNCWMSVKEIALLPREELRSALVLQCLCDYQEGKRIPLESLMFSSNEVALGENCFKLLSKII